MQLCTLGLGCTPPKTNMSRKKEPFQKESSLSSTTFQETTNPSIFFHNVSKKSRPATFWKTSNKQLPPPPRTAPKTTPTPNLLSLRQERLCVILGNRGLHHLAARLGTVKPLGHEPWNPGWFRFTDPNFVAYCDKKGQLNKWSVFILL